MTETAPSSAPVRRLRNLLEVVRIVAAIATAIALAAVLVSSVVLLNRFRPDPLIDDLGFAGGYSPRAWVSLHEVALLVAFVAVLVWAAATATLVRVRTRGATGVVVTATAIAVTACAAASFSWFLVRWEQLALWSVTVGGEFKDAGLWKPATSDDVRFLIVDGVEVSQHSYLVALLVHLAAPVMAALALAVSLLWAKRYRRPTRATGGQAQALAER